MPFRLLGRLLGELIKPQFIVVDKVTLSQTQKTRTARIANLIARVCPKLPWQALCLVQAFVFISYARLFRIPCQTKIGMGREQTQVNDKQPGPNHRPPWNAHAWVMINNHVILGGSTCEDDFAVLASYKHNPMKK